MIKTLKKTWKENSIRVLFSLFGSGMLWIIGLVYNNYEFNRNMIQYIEQHQWLFLVVFFVFWFFLITLIQHIASLMKPSAKQLKLVREFLYEVNKRKEKFKANTSPQQSFIWDGGTPTEKVLYDEINSPYKEFLDVILNYDTVDYDTNKSLLAKIVDQASRQK